MLKSCVFLNENRQELLFFKILRFTVFAVSWLIFELFLPILPFWNSQSLAFKMAHKVCFKKSIKIRMKTLFYKKLSDLVETTALFLPDTLIQKL